jgi:hypothetical protein
MESKVRRKDEEKVRKELESEKGVQTRREKF